MSNPSGPDENVPATGDESMAAPHTEAIPAAEPVEQAEPFAPERRFTAPSPSDAGSTQIIETGPPTEILSVSDAPAGMAASGAQTESSCHSRISLRRNSFRRVATSRHHRVGAAAGVG